MRTLLVLALLVAIAIPTAASHCVTWTTSKPIIDTSPASEAAGQSRFYVTSNCFAFVICPWQVFSIWIYEESNGIGGLQRGDEEIDDTCHGLVEPDTIIL